MLPKITTTPYLNRDDNRNPDSKGPQRHGLIFINTLLRTSGTATTARAGRASTPGSFEGFLWFRRVSFGFVGLVF